MSVLLDMVRVILNKRKSDTQEVAGYEFPASLRFCEETIWILENLARRGCAYCRIDDGIHPEVEELKKAAKEGYFIFQQINNHSFVVFEPEVCEV